MFMSWKKVTLTNDDIAAGGGHRLQDAFAERFIAAGAPHDAVMYGNKDVFTERHHFFFSPAAASVIAGSPFTDYKVTDCSEPKLQILVVLVKNG
jgi:hypothetical protein